MKDLTLINTIEDLARELSDTSIILASTNDGLDEEHAMEFLKKVIEIYKNSLDAHIIGCVCMYTGAFQAAVKERDVYRNKLKRLGALPKSKSIKK